jgi:hypothetical protein
MNAYYLRGDTAEALQSAMADAGLVIAHEDESQSFYGTAGAFVLVWIGEIFEPTGVILDEGTETERKEMASVGGYHCNVCSNLALPSDLDGYLIKPLPTTPARTLAGL